MGRTVFHLGKYLVGMDSARTQTTQAERNAIARYANGKRRAVEIGVFEGVTTSVIAKSMAPDGILFGIDPFVPGRMGICWAKPIARREVARAKPNCKVEFIEKLSHAACNSIDGTFDFIFIDGDHSWDAIVEDWNDWSERMDADGIIALHDTRVPDHNPRVAEFGSHQYFERHIKHDDRFDVLEQVDSLSIVRRKKA
jgi:predicted O-methyltransferase YrrM